MKHLKANWSQPLHILGSWWSFPAAATTIEQNKPQIIQFPGSCCYISYKSDNGLAESRCCNIFRNNEACCAAALLEERRHTCHREESGSFWKSSGSGRGRALDLPAVHTHTGYAANARNKHLKHAPKIKKIKKNWQKWPYPARLARPQSCSCQQNSKRALENRPRVEVTSCQIFWGNSAIRRKRPRPDSIHAWLHLLHP